MPKQKPIFYHYGFAKIHPTDKEEIWEYSIQLHKNQNGKHWDLRLARPGEPKAFSWSMKKIPLIRSKPALAIRSHDHDLRAMDFQGDMETQNGYGIIKLVQRGKARVKRIDEDGIVIEINEQDYRLRPLKKKRYLFEKLI